VDEVGGKIPPSPFQWIGRGQYLFRSERICPCHFYCAWTRWCRARRLSVHLARLFRLYPAIWASVVLFAIVQTSGERFIGPRALEAATIVFNMLLLSTSMNGVMWTLRIEMVAIPLVLLLVLVRLRWGAIPLIIATGTLFVLSFVGAWTRGIGPDLSLNFLLGFALGILVRDAARVVDRLTVRQCAFVFSLAILPFFATRALLGKSTGDFRWITIIEFFRQRS
jgi:hypothetical protein